MLSDYYKSINFHLENEKYQSSPFLKKKRYNIHIYSLCLILKLWDKKHYRSCSFKNDLIKNLQNVIIPNTFIPLSFFCYHKWLYMYFLYVFYPIACFFSFIIHRDDSFEEYLFCPNVWLSYWRINCILSFLNYLKTNNPQYMMEDKFLFLKEAEKIGLSITPYFKKDFILKHKNEEGGLGIQYIKNAENNGSIIIQEKLNNSFILNNFLPKNAALSTFRVVTSCSLSGDISIVTILWRAARENTITDHNNIIFNVEEDGSFGLGVSNQNWYSRKIFYQNTFQKHPDSNKQITGENIGKKYIDEIKELCLKGHKKLLNKIPLVGWDVAITVNGIMILECNLSCNFFCGEFDKNKYFNFVEEYFKHLSC